jgi:transposase-like protein
MSIAKWFVQKIKQLVQSHKDKRLSDEIQKENAAFEEQMRQEIEASKQEYLRQCKEHDEEQAQREKELMAQILEEKRIERLIENEETEAYFEKKYPRCYDCGQNSLHCRCEK